MRKVENFNNTWCVASEIHFEKLKKIRNNVLEPRGEHCYRHSILRIEDNFLRCYEKDIPKNYRQIEYKDNDWYYMEENPQI